MAPIRIVYALHYKDGYYFIDKVDSSYHRDEFGVKTDEFLSNPLLKTFNKTFVCWLFQDGKIKTEDLKHIAEIVDEELIGNKFAPTCSIIAKKIGSGYFTLRIIPEILADIFQDCNIEPRLYVKEELVSYLSNFVGCNIGPA